MSRGYSQVTSQVVIDADGKASTKLVVLKHDSIQSIRKVSTSSAKPPAKEPTPVRDELAEIVDYHKAQLAQIQGPPDTRTYRERIKARMVDAAQPLAPKPEPVPTLPKSLVGRSWKVGNLTATIYEDDGHVCRYRFGALGSSYAIDRDKAATNCRRRSLPTTTIEACASNRPYDSEAPKLKKWTSDFQSTRLG